jgi:hypothetical protein
LTRVFFPTGDDKNHAPTWNDLKKLSLPLSKAGYPVKTTYRGLASYAVGIVQVYEQWVKKQAPNAIMRGRTSVYQKTEHMVSGNGMHVEDIYFCYDLLRFANFLDKEETKRINRTKAREADGGKQKNKKAGNRNDGAASRQPVLPYRLTDRDMSAEQVALDNAPADVVDASKAKKFFDAPVADNHEYDPFAPRETRKRWTVAQARGALERANILASNAKKETSGTELIKQSVRLISR